MYFTECRTPIIGTLTVASDGKDICGCWFDNDRHFGYGIADEMERRDDLAVLQQARDWLDRYFAGERPDPRELPLADRGTAFQKLVRSAMLEIPYGETVTYGDIAKSLEARTGRQQSPRAIGGAVGHNIYCVSVPCHRVVGSDGSLTGFGGGIDRKIALLEFEGAMKPSFKRPKKGTALTGIPNSARMGRGAAYAFSDLTPDDMHEILEAHDSSFAQAFVVADTASRAFWRPGTSNPAPPQERCRYFATAEDAAAAGFRALKEQAE